MESTDQGRNQSWVASRESSISTLEIEMLNTNYLDGQFHKMQKNCSLVAFESDQYLETNAFAPLHGREASLSILDSTKQKSRPQMGFRKCKCLQPDAIPREEQDRSKQMMTHKKFVRSIFSSEVREEVGLVYRSMQEQNNMHASRREHPYAVHQPFAHEHQDKH